MRQLIAVAVILLSVQAIYAGTISTVPAACGCESEVTKKKEDHHTKDDPIRKLKECDDDDEGGCKKEKLALEQQVDYWKCLAEDKIKENSRLAEENANLKNDLAKSQEKLNAQITINIQLQQSLDECTKINDECKTQLTSCQDSFSSCRQKVTDLEQTNRKWDSDYKALKDQSERDAEECAGRTKNLQKTIDDLKSKLEQETKDHRQCEEQLKCLQNDNAELQKKNDQCKEECERLKSHNAFLEQCLGKEKLDESQHVNALQAQIGELRKQIDGLTKERNECQSHNKELASQIERQKQELADQAKECSRNMAELNANQKDKEVEWNCALEKETEANRAAQSEIAKSKDLIKDLKKQLSQKEQELDNCLNERNDFKAKNEQLTKKVEELDCTIKQLRGDLADSESRYNAIVIELNGCRDKLSQCTTELKKCRDDLAAALRKIDEDQSRIAELDGAKKKCETELQSLQCDADKFFGKLAIDSESLSASVVSVSTKSDAIQKDVSVFRGSHKLGCNEKPGCGCPACPV